MVVSANLLGFKLAINACLVGVLSPLCFHHFPTIGVRGFVLIWAFCNADGESCVDREVEPESGIARRPTQQAGSGASSGSSTVSS